MTKKKSVPKEKTVGKKKVTKAQPKLTKQQKATKKFKTLIAAANPEPPSCLEKCVSRTRAAIRSSITTKIVSLFRAAKNKCQQFLYFR